MNKTITKLKTEKPLSKHKTTTLIGTNETTTNFTSITTTTQYPSYSTCTNTTKTTTTDKTQIPVTEEVLFDAAIDILPFKKTIRAGEGLPAQITLFSVGSPKKVDVLLNYIIQDTNGKIITQETETTAVEGQKSFMKEFYIPSDAQKGNYIIKLEVIYATTVATASQMFSLTPPPTERISIAKKNTQTLSILALTLIIVTTGIMIVLKGNKKIRFYRN